MESSFEGVPSLQLAFDGLACNRSTHSMYMLFRALESLVGKDVNPTNGLLAKMLGLQDRTISLLLRALERTGFLRIESHAGGRNRFITLFPWDLEWTAAMVAALQSETLLVDLAKQTVQLATGEPWVLPNHPTIPLAPAVFAGAKGSSACPFPTGSYEEGSEEVTVAMDYGVASVVLCNSTTTGKSTTPEVNATVAIPLQGATKPQLDEAMACSPQLLGGRPSLAITDDMRRVYAGWQTWTKSRKLTLVAGATASRIRSRLRDGFTVDELLLVAEWAAQDPWMSGNHPQNDTSYLSTETLYRSGDRTNNYLEKANRWLRKGKPASGGVFDRRGVEPEMSYATPATGSEVI